MLSLDIIDIKKDKFYTNWLSQLILFSEGPHEKSELPANNINCWLASYQAKLQPFK